MQAKDQGAEQAAPAEGECREREKEMVINLVVALIEGRTDLFASQKSTSSVAADKASLSNIDQPPTTPIISLDASPRKMRDWAADEDEDDDDFGIEESVYYYCWTIQTDR